MTPPEATCGSLPAGVVFDCDGTLADTETLSDLAWTEALAARGYAASEDDFKAVIGRPYAHNWAYFSQRADLGDPAEFRAGLRDRFRQLFDTELEVYDDAADTMRRLAQAGVRIGVASSSGHKHVLRVLDRGDLRAFVRVVVGADDVRRHKPDPEPYLAAASQLGLEPSDCSAVEDTPVGVRSAAAAGLFTVGVVRRYSEPQELQEAHRVVTRVTPAAVVAGSDAQSVGTGPV